MIKKIELTIQDNLGAEHVVILEKTAATYGLLATVDGQALGLVEIEFEDADRLLVTVFGDHPHKDGASDAPMAVVNALLDAMNLVGLARPPHWNTIL